MTLAADARRTDAEIKAREESGRKKAVEIAQLRKDMNETFATASGRRTLRWIMELCGYQRPSIIADPVSGNPLLDGTIYNEARRNLYLSLRRYLSQEILIPVENKGLEVDEAEDMFG